MILASLLPLISLKIIVRVGYECTQSGPKGQHIIFRLQSVYGVDKESESVPHVEITAANIHDVTMISKFLDSEKESVHGNAEYLCAGKRTWCISRLSFPYPHAPYLQSTTYPLFHLTGIQISLFFDSSLTRAQI